MPKNMNAKEIKENTSLVVLLAALGFDPARQSGRELVYRSPLRDSDTKPSFFVNEALNCWYDHGMAKGGNVVDFGLLYWPDLSFPEVLAKIVDTSSADFTVKRKRAPVKIPHYEVLEIRELGANMAIENYLKGRGIWSPAQGVLKEVYYYVEDNQKNRKHFFAAGWQNELGAWEVRSLHFKGCLGHKALSFIPGDEKRLCVFEGFMDYLSWLAADPFCKDSILVLNSVALLQAG